MSVIGRWRRWTNPWRRSTMRRMPCLSGVGVRREIPSRADIELGETELHQPGDATAEHRRDSRLRASGGTAGPREARRDREQHNGGDCQSACGGGEYPPIERADAAARAARAGGASAAAPSAGAWSASWIAADRSPQKSSALGGDSSAQVGDASAVGGDTSAAGRGSSLGSRSAGVLGVGPGPKGDELLARPEPIARETNHGGARVSLTLSCLGLPPFRHPVDALFQRVFASTAVCRPNCALV